MDIRTYETTLNLPYACKVAFQTFAELRTFQPFRLKEFPSPINLFFKFHIMV